MTQIKSRTNEYQALVDNISDFLEMRITAEFDELREDIDDALMLRTVNGALMKENMAFRDQITALTIENMQLTDDCATMMANGAKPTVDVTHGTLFTTLTADQVKAITDWHDAKKPKTDLGSQLFNPELLAGPRINRYLVGEVGPNGEYVYSLKGKE